MKAERTVLELQHVALSLLLYTRKYAATSLTSVAWIAGCDESPRMYSSQDKLYILSILLCVSNYAHGIICVACYV